MKHLTSSDFRVDGYAMQTLTPFYSESYSSNPQTLLLAPECFVYFFPDIHQMFLLTFCVPDQMAGAEITTQNSKVLALKLWEPDQNKRNTQVAISSHSRHIGELKEGCAWFLYGKSSC